MPNDLKLGRHLTSGNTTLSLEQKVAVVDLPLTCTFGQVIHVYNLCSGKGEKGEKNSIYS